jgi:hypothetical protein
VCLRVAERTSVGTFGYVLSLVCLVSARGLLYRSKPSIEVTNVNAGTPECKACRPRVSGPWRARPTAPFSGVHPALPHRWVTKSPGRTPVNSALAGAEFPDPSADSRTGARYGHDGPNAELRA